MPPACPLCGSRKTVQAQYHVDCHHWDLDKVNRACLACGHPFTVPEGA